MTSDKGLCGGFNSSIVRAARRKIRELREQGKEVKIFTVGRKGRDQLRRVYANRIVDTVDFVGIKRIGYSNAQPIGRRVLDMFAAGECDVATMIYSRFKSVISQQPTVQQLLVAARFGERADVDPARARSEALWAVQAYL